MKQDKTKIYDLFKDFLTKQRSDLLRKMEELKDSENALNQLKPILEKIEKNIGKLEKWNNELWKKEIEEMNKLSMDKRVNKVGFTVFCKDRLFIDDEGKTNNYLLAVIIEYYFPMVYFDDFYLFDRGVYCKVDDYITNKIITRIMFVKMNTGTKNEVMDRLKTFNSVTEDGFKKMFLSHDYRLINFKNCYIEFSIDSESRLTSNFTVKQHNPNIFFNIQIPLNFNAKMLDLDLECKTPAFQKYLNSTFNNDDERNLFNEFSGSCLLHTNYVEKMIFARGDGGNGKGTWDRLLKLIFGKNYCNPDGNEMTDLEKRNQFYGLEFVDSYVGFVTEINKNIKDMSFVKKFPGNDEINIQLKNKNKRLKFLPPMKIIFSLNNTAKIYETEEAIKRRVIFLSMNNKIKKDKTLEPKMKKEINFIFYIFFKSLLRLIDRDCVFILPDSHYQLAKICWESNNDFTNFIVNNLVYDENCKGISKKMIFDMMNNEFGNKFKKSKSNFYNLFEAELNNNNIKILIRKDRMDNYIIVNDEITQDTLKLYTSMTPGYAYLKYVESKIDCERESKKALVIYRKSDFKEFVITENPVLLIDDYFVIEDGKPKLIENLSDYLGMTVTFKEENKQMEQMEQMEIDVFSNCY